MSSSLEARYRRLLGWYPRSWRAQHEDAVVGTLLDVAEGDGRDSPTREEQTSIVGHGLETRLDRVVVPGVRTAASAIALTAGTGVALTEFVLSSWAPWGRQFGATGWWPTRVGPFYDTGFLFAGLWIVALVAALTGHWAIGRASLTLSIVASVVTPHLVTGYSAVQSVDRTTLALLASLALLAIVGDPRESGRALPLLGATAGWALLAVAIYLTSPSVPGEWLPSTTLWAQVGTFWYFAVAVIVVASGLAVARFWNAAFTAILSVAPLALTFVVNDLRHDLIESGSATIVAVPAGVGLLLLVLHSTGRLALRDRTQPGPRRSGA
jgi:hypothetical protein